MTKTGTTDDGNVIVTMSEEEWSEFCATYNASLGFTRQHDYGYRRQFNTDLAPFFVALRAFVAANFRLNELEALAADMRKTLGVEKSKP